MSVAGGTLSGAASGAAAGAAFGPWGAAVGGVIGGAAGFFKGKKDKKEADAAQSFFDKNKYEIPESVKAALQNAERQASGVRLPAEDMRRAQMQQVTAQGLGAAQNVATSASDVQAMLAQVYGQQMMGEQNMAIEGAQRYDENQAQLQRAQMLMGGYEDIEWQQNVLAPYNQMINQASLNQQQRAQEMSSVFNTIGSYGAGKIQEQGAQGRYDEYMNYLRGGAEITPFMQNTYNQNFLNKQKGTLPTPFSGEDYRTNLLPITQK